MKRIMKKNWKLIVLLAVFVLLVGGGSVLYKKLSEEYQPDQLGIIDKEKDKNNSAETGSGISENTNKEGSETGDGDFSGETTPTPKEDVSGDGTQEETTQNPAPDFTMETASGEEVALSDLFGKPIVLNFWATWCGFCKEEMPMIQKIYEEFSEDVEFVLLDMVDGGKETVEKAAAYIEEMGFTFPVYYDTKQEGAYAYYVNSLPLTYFIDAKGNLVVYAKGQMTEKMLRKGISMILEETNEIQEKTN